MGYAMAVSPCIGCGTPFMFNPNKVPSVRVAGIREPICRTCVEKANPKRRELGLAPIEIHPDAYEPINEAEL